MLNLAAAKIWLCLEPTDMRKSFDTLAARVREHLRADPLSGSWFVFRGLRGDRLKILAWQGDGFALYLRRLERGTFAFPTADAAEVSVTATELAMILGGVELPGTRRRTPFHGRDRCERDRGDRLRFLASAAELRTCCRAAATRRDHQAAAKFLKLEEPKTMLTWVRMLGAGLATALAAGGAHAESRALLIGVGDVQGHPLPAIDLDIDNMKKVAVIMGFKPDDIKVLFNEQATAADVRQALGTWVKAGGGPDDRVMIYFSGHGTRVPDASSTKPRSSP